MITIEDEEHPNGFPHPEGLSADEAKSLNCEFWTAAPDGRVSAPGCYGFGHYLCLQCASLDPESPLRWGGNHA